MKLITCYFGSFVTLPFDREEGSAFLRNIGEMLPDYTVLHPQKIILFTRGVSSGKAI
jgi:hypothetical protein